MLELAIYPTALSPASIDVHWTAGASPTATPCASTPTSTYAGTVLANHPAAYYQLNDLATSDVAYDSSGDCANGAYSSIDTSVPGALSSDSDTAIETLNNSFDVGLTANRAAAVG